MVLKPDKKVEHLSTMGKKNPIHRFAAGPRHIDRTHFTKKELAHD